MGNSIFVYESHSTKPNSELKISGYPTVQISAQYSPPNETYPDGTLDILKVEDSDGFSTDGNFSRLVHRAVEKALRELHIGKVYRIFLEEIENGRTETPNSPTDATLKKYL